MVRVVVVERGLDVYASRPKKFRLAMRKSEMNHDSRRSIHLPCNLHTQLDASDYMETERDLGFSGLEQGHICLRPGASLPSYYCQSTNLNTFNLMHVAHPRVECALTFFEVAK